MNQPTDVNFRENLGNCDKNPRAPVINWLGNALDMFIFIMGSLMVERFLCERGSLAEVGHVFYVLVLTKYVF